METYQNGNEFGFDNQSNDQTSEKENVQGFNFEEEGEVFDSTPINQAPKKIKMRTVNDRKYIQIKQFVNFFGEETISFNDKKLDDLLYMTDTEIDDVISSLGQSLLLIIDKASVDNFVSFFKKMLRRHFPDELVELITMKYQVEKILHYVYYMIKWAVPAISQYISFFGFIVSIIQYYSPDKMSQTNKSEWEKEIEEIRRTRKEGVKRKRDEMEDNDEEDILNEEEIDLNNVDDKPSRSNVEVEDIVADEESEEDNDEEEEE